MKKILAIVALIGLSLNAYALEGSISFLADTQSDTVCSSNCADQSLSTDGVAGIAFGVRTDGTLFVGADLIATAGDNAYGGFDVLGGIDLGIVKVSAGVGYTQLTVDGVATKINQSYHDSGKGNYALVDIEHSSGVFARFTRSKTDHTVPTDIDYSGPKPVTVYKDIEAETDKVVIGYRMKF